MVFESTRWRLACWNLLVLVVVLAATLSTALAAEARARDADVERELRLGAQRNALALSAEDEEHERELEAYAPDTPDLFAFWIDRRGTVVRNTRGVSLPGLPDADGVRAGLAGREQLADRVVGGVPVRLLSVPVVHDGQVLGVVQVGTSLVGVRQALAQTAAVYVLTGLLGVVLAGLGSLFLAGRAVRPIRDAFDRQRRFLADASHELRTPVAALRARAEVLARPRAGRPDQEQRDLLQIERDADELSQLLGELLDLSRLEAGQVALAVESVALGDVVEEIAAQFGSVADQQHVELVTRSGPIWARANLARLRQVVRALVDNALKHTPAGGRVTLEAAGQGRWAVVRVMDTGEGIPPRDLPRVFDRFYRADGARHRAAGLGGAGLGLSIAAELVRLMRGQIRVESAPDHGTVVTVQLPQVPQ